MVVCEKEVNSMKQYMWRGAIIGLLIGEIVLMCFHVQRLEVLKPENSEIIGFCGKLCDDENVVHLPSTKIKTFIKNITRLFPIYGPIMLITLIIGVIPNLSKRKKKQE